MDSALHRAKAKIILWVRIRQDTTKLEPVKNMNKAHPSAASLYIGTGFAHINRVANVARFIWVNMKKLKKEISYKLQAPSKKELDKGVMKDYMGVRSSLLGQWVGIT